MRILSLDHYYDSFIQDHYATHPQLGRPPSTAQSRVWRQNSSAKPSSRLTH